MKTLIFSGLLSTGLLSAVIATSMVALDERPPAFKPSSDTCVASRSYEEPQAPCAASGVTDACLKECTPVPGNASYMDRPSGNPKCASESNPKCIWIECRRWAYDNPNCNPPSVSEIPT